MKNTSRINVKSNDHKSIISILTFPYQTAFTKSILSYPYRQVISYYQLWTCGGGVKLAPQKTYMYIISTAKRLNPYFYQLNGHISEAVKTNPYLG